MDGRPSRRPVEDEINDVDIDSFVRDARGPLVAARSWFSSTSAQPTKN